MPDEQPPGRVLAAARDAELGGFERRVRRRPGVLGAVLCVASVVVVSNIVVLGGPMWARVLAGCLAFSVVAWAYVWTRRVGGGLYVFRDGFVDAAGRRVVVVRWDRIVSITGERTQYAAGGLPAGASHRYDVRFRHPGSDVALAWWINSTYLGGAHALAGLISARSGVAPSGHAHDQRREAALGRSTVRVELEWVSAPDAILVDLDASVLVLDRDGAAITPGRFVTDGDGPLRIDLAAAPPGAARIVLVVAVHDAVDRGHNFGRVRSGSLRIVDDTDDHEIARRDLCAGTPTDTAIVLGDTCRDGAEWRFRAMTESWPTVRALAAHYCVD